MSSISVKEKVDAIVYCTSTICPNSATYEPDDSIAIFYPVLYIYFTADYLFRITLALTRNLFIDMNLAITKAEAEIVVILSPILGLGGLTFATFGGMLFILGIIMVSSMAALGVAGSVLMVTAVGDADEETINLYFEVVQVAVVLAWRTFIEVDIPALELAIASASEEAT